MVLRKVLKPIKDELELNVGIGKGIYSCAKKKNEKMVNDPEKRPPKCLYMVLIFN